MYAGWVRWGLIVIGVAGATEVHAEAEKKPAPPKEEAEVVAPGTYDAPRRIESVDEMEQICQALQLPLADEHGELDLPETYREAAEAVYVARVGPRGFGFAPYAAASLPLKLGRGLAALEGGLSLAVLDREAGQFNLGPSEAKAIETAARDRKVALDVVFTIDHEAGDLTPCFTLPHSESYNLRVRPLSYALLDVENGTVMARTRTDEHARMLALQGPPKVSITVSHATGIRKIESVEKALRKREDSFAGCLVKDRPNARPDDVVGLSAYVAPAGGVSSVRAEIASMEDEKVARCLEETLRKVVLPASARPSRIGVVVEVVTAEG